MKKTLIAVAVTTAMASLPAVAEMSEPSVEFYGSLNLAVEYVQPEDDNMSSFGEVKSAFSYLGVGGETGVMDDLTAYFAFEIDVNAATGALGESAHTDGARTPDLRSIVGMKGGWGAVEIGRNYTTFANRVAFNTCGFGSGWDCFDTVIYFEQNNTVKYLSPELGGFSFETSVELDGASIDNGSAANTEGTGDTGTRTLRYQVGATYAIGGVSIGAAYDSVGADWPGLQDVYGASVNYANDMVSATVKHENNNYRGDGDIAINTAMVQLFFGKNTLLLHYADGTFNSEDQSEYGIGVQHQLADNVMVFAEVHGSDDVCHSDGNVKDVYEVNNLASGGCQAISTGVHYDF